MNKTLRFFILWLTAICICSPAAADTRGFAIFVDSTSLTKVGPEIRSYADAVGRQSLKPEIVAVGADVTPDSLRSIIASMATRKKAPIEGMVFIGDIPIPMLLDAQHLSSAYKVLQNLKRLERSAVPSDRFYDDLSLKFDFISRDTKKPLLYYYSLRSDSPQSTAPQLYSGRIKSIDHYGRDKYENLRRYLAKLVDAKNRNAGIDEFLYFSGNGYNTESILARVDEKTAHLEQFPWMKQQHSSIHFLDHRNAEFARYPLMSALQNPRISLALLHHHGSPVKEYINRYPEARNARAQLDVAKQFFRSKIRSAVADGVPFDTIAGRFAREYDVPVHWFDGILDSASVAADSIYDEQLDIHIHNFDKYRPNARVVILDACYNGSFNNDIYIGGAYIFGDGDCVAVIANSVNSLQDKVSDRNIGLFGLGMRIGNFVKYNPYLESHVIGDPTFSFASHYRLPIDINDALYQGPAFWKKQLDSEYPAMQAMAIQQLAEAGQLSPDYLLDIMRTSDNYIVRLNALLELAKSPTPQLVEALKLGLNDSYELIRRFSAIYAGKNGSPELIPAIVRSLADDLKGDRVNFQLRMAMPLFSHELIKAEVDRQQPWKHSVIPEATKNKIYTDIADRISDAKFAGEVALLKSGKTNTKELNSFFRTLRNNPLHPAVEQIIGYLFTTEDENQQIKILEALGWFNLSYRAPYIAEKMNEIINNPAFSDKARDEARRTLTRLTEHKRR